MRVPLLSDLDRNVIKFFQDTVTKIIGLDVLEFELGFKLNKKDLHNLKELGLDNLDAKSLIVILKRYCDIAIQRIELDHSFKTHNFLTNGEEIILENIADSISQKFHPAKREDLEELFTIYFIIPINRALEKKAGNLGFTQEKPN